MTIFDLYVEQGSTFVQTIYLGEDLTGYTVASNMKDRTGATTKNIVAMLDLATGEIKISLTAIQTSLMSVGVGKYDIELTETSSGSVRKPLSGRVYIKGEVTV